MIVDFRSVAPVLPVRDVAAAAAWYQSALGFGCQTFPKDPPFQEAILWRDDVRIVLTAAEESGRPPAGAMFTVKGIRGFYEAIRERVIVTKRLTRSADGALSFEMADPDGYTLGFTEEPDAA